MTIAWYFEKSERYGRCHRSSTHAAQCFDTSMHDRRSTGEASFENTDISSSGGSRQIGPYSFGRSRLDGSRGDTAMFRKFPSSPIEVCESSSIRSRSLSSSSVRSGLLLDELVDPSGDILWRERGMVCWGFGADGSERLQYRIQSKSGGSVTGYDGSRGPRAGKSFTGECY